MNAGEICSREVVVAYRNMTLPEAAKLMRALAGIITIDDVLDVLAEELSDVVHAVERERVRETRVRR